LDFHKDTLKPIDEQPAGLNGKIGRNSNKKKSKKKRKKNKDDIDF
jgi:hypothetical protein